MKVLIDTNILISAALNSRGTPYHAFIKAVSFPYRGIICEQNINEMRQIFNRKFPQKLDALNTFLMLASLTIEKVPAPSNVGYRDTTTIVIGGNNNSNSESEYNPNTGAELPLNAMAFATLCAAMLAVVKKR